MTAIIKNKHTPARVEFGNLLRRYRQDKQLTMRQMSDRLKCPHSLIGKVENNERRLDVVELMAYCAALEVCPAQLIAVFKSQHGTL